jgi:hypothetical protein
MLEMEFFWAPAICYLVENDLDDFRIGVVNPGSSLSIKMDMSSRGLRPRDVLPLIRLMFQVNHKGLQR